MSALYLFSCGILRVRIRYLIPDRHVEGLPAGRVEGLPAGLPALCLAGRVKGGILPLFRTFTAPIRYACYTCGEAISAVGVAFWVRRFQPGLVKSTVCLRSASAASRIGPYFPSDGTNVAFVHTVGDRKANGAVLRMPVRSEGVESHETVRNCTGPDGLSFVELELRRVGAQSTVRAVVSSNCKNGPKRYTSIPGSRRCCNACARNGAVQADFQRLPVRRRLPRLARDIGRDPYIRELLAAVEKRQYPRGQECIGGFRRADRPRQELDSAAGDQLWDE